MGFAQNPHDNPLKPLIEPPGSQNLAHGRTVLSVGVGLEMRGLWPLVKGSAAGVTLSGEVGDRSFGEGVDDGTGRRKRFCEIERRGETVSAESLTLVWCGGDEETFEDSALRVEPTHRSSTKIDRRQVRKISRTSDLNE